MSLFDDLPEPEPAAHSAALKRSHDEAAAQEEEPVGGKSSRMQYLRLQSSVAARRGEREDMQDMHVILDDMRSGMPEVFAAAGVPPFHDRLAFYAVYDGHSGAATSRYAAEHLHRHLARKLADALTAGGSTALEKLLDDMKRVWPEVYRRVDDGFLKVAAAARPALKDGSTATTVLVVNNTLLVANVGDTRSVLYRSASAEESQEKLKCLVLTSDHNPSVYTERQRIQRSGGQVRDGRLNGVIEVSRSLGDAPFKRLGIISAPDLRRCVLQPGRDRALVLACDGLWNCWSTAQVGEELQKSGLFHQHLRPEERRVLQEQLTARLANEAVRRLSGDNVTVLIVTFHCE